MRNLEISNVSRKQIKDSFEGVSHVASTPENLYVLKNSYLQKYDIDTGELVYEFDQEYISVTSFEILTFENKLCFTTESALVCVDIAENTTIAIAFDDVISAAAWNPAQDVLAVVTDSKETGVCTIDFQNEYVTWLQRSHLDNTVSTSEYTALGWGSAKTQFRGTAGKNVTDSTEEVLPRVTYSKVPMISWRGNGEMFLVNYWANEMRQFKVYEYPCDLKYQSEAIVGLDSVISWRPEGNMIAAVVKTSTNTIAIFEKNGLVRCSFEVDKDKVKEFKWSPAGDVLIIHQTHATGSYLSLYVMKNYTWYLKHRLSFPKDNKLINYTVLEGNSLCTLLVTTVREITTYSFKYTVHCDSFGTNFVINGRQVLISTCKTGLVPPPMCDYTIPTKFSVNYVAFHPYQQKLAVIDCNNTIFLYKYDQNGAELLGSSNGLELLRLHQVVWLEDAKIACLVVLDSEATGIYLLDVDTANANEWIASLECEMDKDVAAIGRIPHVANMIVQLHTSYVALMKLDDKTEQTVCVLPASTVHVSAASIEGKIYVFSLTCTNVFFINGTEILRHVTSFLIHDCYLFLTSTRNVLYGFRLSKQTLSEISSKFDDCYTRPIEQGSSLICGIPGKSHIIVQTPRGNLETITCPIISIDRVENLVQNEQWSEALDLVLVERLNSNVLVDTNIPRFLDNIRNFIILVKTPSVLIDFLLNLRDDNVLESIYSYYGLKPSNGFLNKRELICEEIIKQAKQVDYAHYITIIVVACYAKRNSSSLHEALQHIRNFLHSMSSNPSLITAAEEALRHLCSLENVGEIYNTSLAMYDFDLALFVAKNIGMDPKEYEPFITKLKSQEICPCRFTVNDYLKKHSIATLYLLRYEQNPRVITDYVNKYKTYKEAYENVSKSSPLFVEITRIFAEFLNTKSLHEEAATLYVTAKLWDDALMEYTNSLNWREAVYVMKELKLGSLDVNTRLRCIIDGLLKQGKVKDAAHLYTEYLKDYESAIKILLEKNHFSESIEVARRWERNDILESDVLPAVLSYCRDLTAKVESMHHDFRKYTERLVVVRQEKLANLKSVLCPHEGLQFSNQQTHENDDLYSLADSQTTVTRSTSSRSSTMSSRNRRKEERKKQDLREGGMYEDIALLRVLHEIVHETFDLNGDVRKLCLIILQFGDATWHSAKTLQNLLVNLQNDVKNSIQDVWPANLNEICQSDEHELKILQQNISLLDVKYRYPPEHNINHSSWKLTILE